MELSRNEWVTIAAVIAAVLISVGILWFGNDEDAPSAPPRRGTRNGDDEMSEKQKNPNQAQGRQNAPGQQKTRTFVNDAGETVEGTMQDFHNTLQAQGFRPAAPDEGGDEEVPAETPPA